MSAEGSDGETPDIEMGSPKAEPNGNVVKYGELNMTGKDSVAAGVAAGNIHLQSADAATLALPEVRFVLARLSRCCMQGRWGCTNRA